MDLDAETLGLSSLVRVQGADADLYQTTGEAVLHDPGEWTGVGFAVALELVIEIGVGIEVEDRQPRVPAGGGSHDGIGDGMVAAEGDDATAGLDKARDCLGRWLAECGVVEFKIPPSSPARVVRRDRCRSRCRGSSRGCAAPRGCGSAPGRLPA